MDAPVKLPKVDLEKRPGGTVYHPKEPISLSLSDT